MRGVSGASSSSIPFKEDGGKKETDALVVAHNRANASREDGGYDSPQHAPKALRYYADEEKAAEKEGEEERSPFYHKVPLSPRNLGVNDRRFDEKDWRRNGVLHLLACAMVNVIALGAYGVLQQRIMTIPYRGFVDEEGNEVSAVFTSSIFLVFSNRLFSLLFGMVALAYTKPERVSLFSREWWWPHSSLENYACVALSNLMSTLCQYEVLKYLSFAISTLAKAAKILPTMLWGYVLHRTKFRLDQYVSAMIVTVGCFVFVFNSKIAAHKVVPNSAMTSLLLPSPTTQRSLARLEEADLRSFTLMEPTRIMRTASGSEEEVGSSYILDSTSSLVGSLGAKLLSRAQESIYIGVCILLVYLAADGFTSSYQQRLFRVKKTSIFDQMFWMCVFGTLLSGIWLICCGQLSYCLTFLRRYPKINRDIVYLSLSSAFSQVAITYTIHAFGAVTLASIMTIRQVVSIALNSVVFRESLNTLQWLGLGFIVLPAVLSGDWFKKELESGPSSFSHWDLKKLSTDSIVSEKKPDGREHFRRVPSSFSSSPPLSRERREEGG
jgi:drug/metabolite transporter (DMT)-like permease